MEYKEGDLLYTSYRIVEVIKTGGFGIVYVCRDLRTKESSTLWVLKSFKDDFFENEGVVKSFYHEAELWIKLGAHPNIVTAFAVWPIAEKPHILLEFVDGGNLGDWIRDKVIDLRMFLIFSLQFCWGMTHANNKDLGEGKKGIVHRDIKPSNILLTSNGILKITDFGLVKALGTPSAGRIVGTPEYMSPEQFETMNVDTRADIYSFGVVLYEMLIGRPPFWTGDEKKRWVFCEKQHKETQPRPPRQIDPSIPEEVEKLVLKCLEKDPEDRYGTFDALENELEICQDHFGRRPLSPYKEVDVGVLSSNVRNHMLLSWGSSLVTLGKDREAMQHLDKLLEMAPRNALAWASKGSALYKLGRLEEALKHVERAIELDPRNTYGWGLKGAVLGKLGRYEEALECFDKATYLDSRLTNAWLGKGDCLSRLDRCEEALGCVERAIDLDPREAVAWRIKGNVLERLGRYEEALKCYDRAIQINPRSARAWSIKGDYLSRLGRFDEAFKCYERARKLKER